MENSNPRFSIITINLNNREGLKKTIQSVMGQECGDYEYIIVDGGSTDGSVDTIREYEHFITHWTSEKDSGIYNAMNKGLARARGEYVYFLNSGDFFHSPHVLSNIHQIGICPDIICGRVVTFGNGFQKLSPPWEYDSFYFIVSNFCHQAMFMKTQLCKRYPFDETYRICADKKMLLSLLLQESASFMHTNNLIAYFDLSGISNTATNVLIAENTRSLEEALPPVILNDYRLLLPSRLSPYYMNLLIHFQNPKKNFSYWLARVFRFVAKHMLKLSTFYASKAK